MSAEFVDTNILIYAHDSSSGGKQRIARDLLRRLEEDGNGALSIQVLTEFYSVSTRKLGLPLGDAEQVVAGFETWALHRPTLTDVVSAAAVHRHHKVAWWDALLIHSAIQLECDILWTEDLNHGQQYGSVTVRNPFAEAASA